MAKFSKQLNVLGWQQAASSGRGPGLAGIDWWEGPITGGWPDPALGVITSGSTDSGTGEL